MDLFEDWASVTENMTEGDTAMLRNVGNNKCLYVERNTDNWMSTWVVPCDSSNTNQQFTWDGSALRNKSECITVTYEGDANLVGRQFRDVRIMPCSGGFDATVRGRSNMFAKVDLSGPFRIQSQKSMDLAFTDDGGTVKNLPVDTTNATQLWLTNDVATFCLENGIPLKECTASGRSNCEKFPSLKNRFEVCPQQFCERFPTDSKCVNWCKTNVNKPGVCDGIYTRYCRANPKDLDVCACLNRAPMEAGFDEPGWNQIMSKPLCYLSTCANNPNAYKTHDMVTNTMCPSIQICSNRIDLNAKNNVITENVTVSCSNESNSAATNTNNNSSNTANKNSSNSSNVQNNSFGGALIAIIVVVVAAIVGFLVWYFKFRARGGPR